VTEISGPVDRVVVVGAGIAGLAAASRLRRAGIACVVLEARDRIGGRLHTIDLVGSPVDLGGSWIHHPVGNPLTAFCDEHGIVRDPGDATRSLSGYDRVAHRRLDRDETERITLAEPEVFWERIGEFLERLGPDATGLAAIDAFVADRGHAGADARRLRQELLAEVEAGEADFADNVSLRGMSAEDVFEGPVFGDLPRDGYRSVVAPLAAGTDIRLETEVVEVSVRADGVDVTCADGAVEAGFHVIVTVPLGVLKRGGPRFEPALPVQAQEAVDALGFGRYEKIALRFDSAFWRDDGISHLVVYPANDDEPALWVFDLDAFGAGPVLCAHLFPTLTTYALDRPPTQAVEWFMQVLSEVFGRRVPAPVASVVTSWATDRFARGAYSHCPPGADPAMHDLLAEPVHGRVLLAGEHTQSARYGYADGAYVSGLKAAERLGA
jgi:polyamine oxidase